MPWSEGGGSSRFLKFLMFSLVMNFSKDVSMEPSSGVHD
jgi:hypothetical protein